MRVNEYERKLNNIITMAPMECGTQTLVYMLLDEIIENCGLVLLDVDTFGQKSVFARKLYKSEESGVPDMCITEKSFDFDGQMEEERTKRKACVEVKPTNTKLPGEIKNRDQIIGHILEYKRVIYTNGCVWIYFDATGCSNSDIATTIDKNLKSYIKETLIDDTNINRVPDWIKWIIPIVKLDDKFILSTNPKKRDKIKIDVENYSRLLKALYEIDWGKTCQRLNNK